MRPDRVSATKTLKVWNRRVIALSGLSKLRPDLQDPWVLRQTECPLNGYARKADIRSVGEWCGCGARF